MKINPGGCSPSPLSPLQPQWKPMGSNLTANWSAHRTSHLKRTRDKMPWELTESANGDPFYPVVSLKNYHRHLSMLKIVCVCVCVCGGGGEGCFSSLIYFLFSTNHLKNLKISLAPDKKQ